MLEALTAFKRAGADAILTYFALDAARWLAEGRALTALRADASSAATRAGVEPRLVVCAAGGCAARSA